MTDRERAEYCESCRATHQGEPPCETCEWRQPELDPNNEEALELWLASRTQWRAGGVGVVGIDYLAVQQEAERLEIDLNRCLMRKVQALEQLELKKQHGTERDNPGNGPPAKSPQGPAQK